MLLILLTEEVVKDCKDRKRDGYVVAAARTGWLTALAEKLAKARPEALRGPRTGLL